MKGALPQYDIAAAEYAAIGKRCCVVGLQIDHNTR